MTACIDVAADGDATIANPPMTANYGSDEMLRVGGKDQALLHFTLPALPPDAVIDSATVRLFVSKDGDGTPINLHRASAPWTEATVTFGSFAQRFDPAIVGALVTTSANALKSIDITATVKSWVLGTHPNHGLLLETASNKKVTLVSREGGIASEKPSLRVCYSRPDNHCLPDPCQHGTCENLEYSYECHCDAGFAGMNCETNIDDCAGAPCQNGGACSDIVGGYTCACPDGFAGTTCETNIDECAAAPCVNGGVCEDRVAGRVCHCVPGYAGADCEIVIDNCETNPCEHGGTCTNGVASYTCSCPTGYAGVNCELDIDDCAADPCNNGGVCIDGVSSFSCACPPDWGGALCEVNLNTCAQQPCLHGACTNGYGDYTCKCDAGYEGRNCEIDTNDCEPNPCQNNGVCADGVATYSCTCSNGFGGTHCEVPPLLAAAGVTFHATQGVAAESVVLGTFVSRRTDANGVIDTNPPVTIAVDWGDGSTSIGSFTVADASAGLFVIRAPGHAYRTMGSHTVTIHVSDPVSSSVAAAVANVDAPEIVAWGMTLHFPQGIMSTAPYDVRRGPMIAAFATALQPAGNIWWYPNVDITVDWGDGTTSPGRWEHGGVLGTWYVVGDPPHAYLAEGTYNVTITIVDRANLNATAVASSTIHIDVPQLDIAGMVLDGIERGPTRGEEIIGFVRSKKSASQQEYEGLDVFVDWGDGTAETRVDPRLTDGGWHLHVGGWHQYTAVGTYTARLTARDRKNGATATTTMPMHVTRPAYSPMGVTFRATAGVPIGQVAVAAVSNNRFAPDYLSSAGLKATIDWGDGTTSAGVERYDVYQNLIHFVDATTAGHTYTTAGTYPVTVTLEEMWTSVPVKVIVRSTAVIDAAPPSTPEIRAYGVTFEAARNTFYSGIVATFSDSTLADDASRFKVEIDWGDSTTTAGAAVGRDGMFSVVDYLWTPHLYRSAGTFPVTVRLLDATTNQLVATGTSMANVRHDVRVHGVDFKTVQNRADTFLVASFTTEDWWNPALGLHTATIDYGDGLVVSAAVEGGFGHYVVRSRNYTHVYAAPGTYAAKVTVIETATQLVVGTANVTGTVAPQIIPDSTVFHARAGAPTRALVASFSDHHPDALAAAYGATIDWGDGTTSAGTPLGDLNTAGVVDAANHRYAREGTYNVTTSISSGWANGVVDTITSTATVSPRLRATGRSFVVPAGAAYGNAVASFDSSSASDAASSFAASIEWGDGTVSAGAVFGDAGMFVVAPAIAHAYASGGQYTVRVNVYDASVPSTHATAISSVLVQ